MSEKLTTTEFVQRAAVIHGNKYDYGKTIYGKDNKEKVTIICPIHGEFHQKPNSHLRGCGCVFCSGKYTSNTNDFIKKAREIHGDKYDYSKSTYVSAHVPVIIRCPEHGVYKQKPNTHLNGSGCLKCGFVKTATSRRKSQAEFITEAKHIHGDLYDYSKTIYEGEHRKLQIICKKHGEFWQTPHLHLHRDSCGCPKCRLSKGEQRIMAFFDQNKIAYIPQKSFDDCRNPKTGRMLKFDFYIPKKNILVEYDGNQHFMCGRKLGNYVSTKKDLEGVQWRDAIKTQYASKRGIELMRIKYTELNRIPKILSEMLIT
jgi:very-short-patch-repair endonuclease